MAFPVSVTSVSHFIHLSWVKGKTDFLERITYTNDLGGFQETSKCFPGYRKKLQRIKKTNKQKCISRKIFEKIKESWIFNSVINGIFLKTKLRLFSMLLKTKQYIFKEVLCDFLLVTLKIQNCTWKVKLALNVSKIYRNCTICQVFRID